MSRGSKALVGSNRIYIDLFFQLYFKFWMENTDRYTLTCWSVWGLTWKNAYMVYYISTLWRIYKGIDLFVRNIPAVAPEGLIYSIWLVILRWLVVHLWLTSEYFIIVTLVNYWMRKNNHFNVNWLISIYISVHCWLFYAYKVRWNDPRNFLTKRALLSQQGTLVVAKDSNILHNLNLSIYSPMVVVVIISFTPNMIISHKWTQTVQGSYNKK